MSHETRRYGGLSSRVAWADNSQDECLGVQILKRQAIMNLKLTLGQSVAEFLWVDAASPGINVLGASSIMFNISAGSTPDEILHMARWSRHLSPLEETASQHLKPLQRRAARTHLSTQVSFLLITLMAPIEAHTCAKERPSTAVPSTGLTELIGLESACPS